MEIMALRIVWCALFVWLYLLLREGWRWWQPILRQPRQALALGAAGVVIGANWWLYIWAVNNDHVVEASLGYFINPLVNVALGVLLLGETLNRRQALAIVLAAAGVIWLTYDHGRLPWIGLGLALAFAAYGLLRKLTPVGAISGLGIETTLLAPLALALLALSASRGELAFGAQLWPQDTLLALGGLVTAVPLILFAYGARRIPLTQVGLLQYLAPTIQLLLGVFWLGEPFGPSRALGFALIWAALAVYALDSLLRARRPLPVAAPAE